MGSENGRGTKGVDVEEVEEEPAPGLYIPLSMRTRVAVLAAIVVVILIISTGVTINQLVGTSPLNDSMEQIKLLLHEDFDGEDKDPSWVWRLGTVGTINQRGGFAFLNISETEEAVLSEAGLHGSSSRWLYASMEVRLRCSDDTRAQSDTGGGMKYWGFVDQAVPGDALGFISYGPESDPDVVGFWVKSVASHELLFSSRVDDVDIREWHTYKILWEENNATFLIDGRVVASTENVTHVPLRFETIVNSGRYTSDSGGDRVGDLNFELIDLEDEAWIQIDYVQVFTGREQYDRFADDISGLSWLARASVADAEGGGTDVGELRRIYGNAQTAWANCDYPGAKESLEKILVAVSRIDEVSGMFSKAQDLIDEAERSGMDTSSMRRDYSAAESSWKKFDYGIVKLLLRKILRRESEIQSQPG